MYYSKFLNENRIRDGSDGQSFHRARVRVSTRASVHHGAVGQVVQVEVDDNGSESRHLRRSHLFAVPLQSVK